MISLLNIYWRIVTLHVSTIIRSSVAKMAPRSLVFTFVCVVLVTQAGCLDAGPDWLTPQPESHPCSRPCRAGDVRSCHYTFSLEWYYAMSKACYDCPRTLADCYRPDCVAVDGVTRSVVVVNRQLPGPSIQVCLGDMVTVDLENKMNDESTSIHWHGHHQVKSPFMDGVPYVTQCPIAPNSVFRYTMFATNRGTHFWHAHTGVQRSDGVFGALVVRTSDDEEEHLSRCDLDLPEHVMVVNDWTHVTGTDKLLNHLQSSGNNKGDTILVNGRGRYYNDTRRLTDTPLAVFTVKQGLRYRFRLINSGVHNCPQEMNIDDHNIIAIASDGYDFDAVEVESLVSYAGERWDFVVDAKMPVANYWIRFTGLLDCDERFTKAHQVAVLHYEGAPEVEPEGKVGYNVHPKSKLILNPLNVGADVPGTITVPKLHASNKTEDFVLIDEKPDKQFFLSFDFNAVDHPMYHKAHLYGFHQANSTYQRYTPQFDHVSFKSPHSPLLTQIDDVDPDLFCDKHDLSNCRNTFCECISVIKIPTGSIVELILIDEGVVYNANHPFHLHGYGFRVVGMDRLGESTHVEYVRQLDRLGKLKRNLDHSPFKDTVTVPDGGYTILRFHATNPGYWLFHCHIEFHLEVGMAVVFKIGEHDELPPIPDGFPKCGDFKNTIKKKGLYGTKG